MIPPLPFKGDMSFMLSRKDQKVIEYRKAALRSYLQALLNEDAIQNNQALQDFITASYSEGN